MSEHGFETAPNMGRNFGESAEFQHTEKHLDHDAAEWEPWDEEYGEEPSEKHSTLEFTPGGTLEQEVHQEVDGAARARILQAQRDQYGTHDLEDEKELDFGRAAISEVGSPQGVAHGQKGSGTGRH